MQSDVRSCVDDLIRQVEVGEDLEKQKLIEKALALEKETLERDRRAESLQGGKQFSKGNANKEKTHFEQKGSQKDLLERVKVLGEMEIIPLHKPVIQKENDGTQIDKADVQKEETQKVKLEQKEKTEKVEEMETDDVIEIKMKEEVIVLSDSDESIIIEPEKGI